VLRSPAPPVVRYAIARAPKKQRTYDPACDVWEGVTEAYHCIRRRKAAGGPGWVASGDVATNNKIVNAEAGQ
jgi:hypothetical protein